MKKDEENEEREKPRQSRFAPNSRRQTAANLSNTPNDEQQEEHEKQRSSRNTRNAKRPTPANLLNTPNDAENQDREKPRQSRFAPNSRRQTAANLLNTPNDEQQEEHEKQRSSRNTRNAKRPTPANLLNTPNHAENQEREKPRQSRFAPNSRRQTAANLLNTPNDEEQEEHEKQRHSRNTRNGKRHTTVNDNIVHMPKDEDQEEHEKQRQSRNTRNLRRNTTARQTHVKRKTLRLSAKRKKRKKLLFNVNLDFDKDNRPKRQPSRTPKVLPVLSLLAVLFGLTLGFELRTWNGKNFASLYVERVMFPGQIYLRLLSSLTLPILITGVVSAVSTMPGKIKKITMISISFCVLSTIGGTIVGVTCATIFQPGHKYNNTFHDELPHIAIHEKEAPINCIMDTIRNMIPSNLVLAWTHHSTTYIHKVHAGNSTQPDLLSSTGNFNQDIDPSSIKIQYIGVQGANIIGIFTVSLIVGYTMSENPKISEHLVHLFEESCEIFLDVTQWLLWVIPISVMFLITANLMSVRYIDVYEKVALLSCTVLLAFVVYNLIILPGLYYYITKTNPYSLMMCAIPALVNVFVTGSSIRTIPITIECLEQYSDIDKRIIRYIVAISATTNKCGNALYIAIIRVFFLQYHNQICTVPKTISILSMTAIETLTTSTDGKSNLFSVVYVLLASDVPLTDIALIFPFEWLLNKFRGCSNVMSDILCTGLVWHYFRGDIETDNESNFVMRRSRQVFPDRSNI